MALAPIDSQITVARTTEFSKDLSNTHKRSELIQDYMSAQRKAGEEAQKGVIAKLERKEEVQITRDRKGTGQEKYNRDKKDGEKENSQEQETPERDREHLIDIRI